jgi:protein SCO1/2
LASGISIPFVAADTRKANYLVEHSANLALIGPDGRQRGFVRGPIDNRKMIAQLPGLVAGE